MDLTNQNKIYWSSVPAGKTTSTDIVPTEEEYSFLKPGMKVLDVGCGDGQLCEILSEKGLDVYGIDINNNAIQSNKDRNSKVQYSVQDFASETTSFENESFDFVSFKFALTNMSKDEWPTVKIEAERIVKKDGYVWVVEPLISPDYEKRYMLSKSLLGDDKALFVFNNPETAAKIKTREDLHKAMENNEISRISRHFDRSEIMDIIFPSFTPVTERVYVISSPSGYNINTLIILMKRK